jgi:hypothetical protein
LLQAGARRLDAAQIRALVVDKEMVAERGVRVSRLRLKADGTIAGTISGTAGVAGIWGKWQIAETGFLCTETRSSYWPPSISCRAIYDFEGRHYVAGRRGPDNTAPPPDTTANMVSFRP